MIAMRMTPSHLIIYKNITMEMLYHQHLSFAVEDSIHVRAPPAYSRVRMLFAMVVPVALESISLSNRIQYYVEEAIGVVPTPRCWQQVSIAEHMDLVMNLRYRSQIVDIWYARRGKAVNVQKLQAEARASPLPCYLLGTKHLQRRISRASQATFVTFLYWQRLSVAQSHARANV